MKHLAIAALILALASCASPTLETSSHGSPWHGAPTPNGRTIFETGRDLNGVEITAAQRPLYPSCAACHGVKGGGGVHLPGGAVSADLRYAALVTRQKHPYTIALLERAISRGLDNEGKPLNAIMPRWHMSKKDLADVALYVTTLK